MDGEREPTFRIGGEKGHEVVALVERRVADRLARGVYDTAEIERIAAMKLRLFAGGDAASELFRRCCMNWEVEVPEITSHRPVIGPVLVAAKRLVRRLLRFQGEAVLARQRAFNWNLLLVLREVLERDRRPD